MKINFYQYKGSKFKKQKIHINFGALLYNNAHAARLQHTDVNQTSSGRHRAHYLVLPEGNLSLDIGPSYITISSSPLADRIDILIDHATCSSIGTSKQNVAIL